MKAGIRIIICDDHPLIMQGVYSFLNEIRDIKITGTATTGKQCMELLSKTEADVLLLDIRLPDADGVELCEKIKINYPDLKIIGLSILDDKLIILKMLHAGASGYILKTSPLQVIEKAIRSVFEENIFFDAATQKILARQTEMYSNDISPITKREKEVLKYLEQGLTSVEIGKKMFISPLTVDTHRKNLLKKFDVTNTISLLQKAKECKDL